MSELTDDLERRAERGEPRGAATIWNEGLRSVDHGTGKRPQRWLWAAAATVVVVAGGSFVAAGVLGGRSATTAGLTPGSQMAPADSVVNESTPSPTTSAAASEPCDFVVVNASGTSAMAGEATSRLSALIEGQGKEPLNSLKQAERSVVLLPGQRSCEALLDAAAAELGIVKSVNQPWPTDATDALPEDPPLPPDAAIVIIGNDLSPDVPDPTQEPPKTTPAQSGEPVAGPTITGDQRAAVLEAFRTSSDPELANLKQAEPDPSVPKEFQDSEVSLTNGERRLVQVTKLVGSPEVAVKAASRNSGSDPEIVTQGGVVTASWETTTGQLIVVVATDSVFIRQQVTIIDPEIKTPQTLAPAAVDANLEGLVAVAQRLDPKLAS